MKKLKIAIAHDWLTGMRGGEKCLEVFCELFPEATIFTLLHNKGSVSPVIEKMDIRTSFLQRFPGISDNYRNFLPLFPKAIESFDLAGYDLVLSSSHCVAKGIRVPPGALHICYCYTPMRYAWELFDEYFSGENILKKWIISKVIKRLRKWDIESNKRIDYFIAISDNVKNRIRNNYNKDADIIYPPAEVSVDQYQYSDKGFHLIVSALVPYKRVDLAVSAFNENGKPLVVIGKGPDLERLKSMSRSNITFLGWVADNELQKHYAQCSTLIFPGVEDFGIVPVEAQGYGKPVIAYASGGVLETVIPFEMEKTAVNGKDATGVFFYKQTVSDLNKAIGTFEENRDIFHPERIKNNAIRFNRDRFKKQIFDYIEDKLEKHKTN